MAFLVGELQGVKARNGTVKNPEDREVGLKPFQIGLLSLCSDIWL